MSGLWHHPGGMAENSPTFQCWVREFRRAQVPKGRLKPGVIRQPSLRDLWGCGGGFPTLKRWAVIGCPSGTTALVLRRNTADSTWAQSHRWPEARRRGQPMHSEARNAKNTPECPICGVLPNGPPPTGSVLWLVPISFPRSAPRRAGRTNLQSDGGTAALHDARVGNRPLRQNHLTGAELPGDVCPTAARQARQPFAPRRPIGKPALNPPTPPFRPAPKPSNRFPNPHPPSRRHLPATYHESRNTPTWKQNDQSENGCLACLAWSA